MWPQIGTDISYIEWLVGSACVLDIFMTILLSVYILQHRSLFFQTPICIAFGLWLCVLGQVFARSNTWWLLHKSHIEGFAELDKHFPIVGSFGYSIGTSIVMLGLIKLSHTFGQSYFGVYAWLVAFACSLFLPLFALL